MELRLLGPIELVGDDLAPIELPGGKPRLLLALLALQAGRVVSVERLVDGLWGEQPPETAAKVVLGYVSRLRKLLPPGVLATREPGYVLHLEGGARRAPLRTAARRGSHGGGGWPFPDVGGAARRGADALARPAAR